MVARFTIISILGIALIPPATRANDLVGGGVVGGGARGATPSQLVIRFKKEPLPDDSEARRLRVEIRQAQSELNRALVAARRQFIESPEYATAMEELQRAGGDYRSARDAALVELRPSQEYILWGFAIEQLERRLDELHAADAPAGSITTLAAELLERRGELTAREAEVLRDDARFNAARYALMDADSAAAALWRDFYESLRHDPACVSARQRIDAARTRLANLSRR